jgi:enoyl-CoA hydratase/carnithine racemase
MAQLILGYYKLHITLHPTANWRITFDNPPLNLINPHVMHDLQDLINQFENAANELKVVVFDDANPYFYIAHVDILCEASIGTGPSGLELLPDFMQGKVYRLQVISIVSIATRWPNSLRSC